MILLHHRKEGEKRVMSYEDLMDKYTKQLDEISRLKNDNDNMKIEINNLKRIIYGVKREHTPKQEQIENSVQCSLFEDNTNIDDEIEEQVKKNVEEITIHKKKNSKEKKAGIKKSRLKDTEIEIIEYKINEEEKCPECGSDLKEVGKEVVRQEIKYIPAKLVITNYVQYTYKCTMCGTKDSENANFTFVKIKLPKPLLTHSFVSPSLATEVIYQKYYLGVPLYRQEKYWDDKGLILPRNMMANWNIKITEYYLEELYNLMLYKLKTESKLLHSDETTIQCNKEANRKASSNSYMWVLCSGENEENKGVIFKYSPSRSAETAKSFLSGFKETLVTDGYASYNNLEEITHAECWAHCRRYFYDSIPLKENKQMDTNSDGYKGVQYCDELFKIEREIANLSMPEKLKMRNEKSKPVLEKFFNWVNSTLTEKIVLNKKLKEALTYASNQQKELSEFLNDANIPLTNSLAERAIRPFAVHRKNWLFADSVEGAKTNAVMYSLIESAKLNNLNIEKYIRYLLEELPQQENLQDENVLEKYLPWSKELPEEILNYEGEYEELDIEKNL